MVQRKTILRNLWRFITRGSKSRKHSGVFDEIDLKIDRYRQRIPRIDAGGDWQTSNLPRVSNKADLDHLLRLSRLHVLLRRGCWWNFGRVIVAFVMQGNVKSYFNFRFFFLTECFIYMLNSAWNLQFLPRWHFQTLHIQLGGRSSKPLSLRYTLAVLKWQTRKTCFPNVHPSVQGLTGGQNHFIESFKFREDKVGLSWKFALYVNLWGMFCERNHHLAKEWAT